METQAGPSPLADQNLPEVIGCQEQTLRALVREYLFVSLYKACAESLASENASRLAAMQRAEKNIDDLVGDLNQTFRRLRQTSIDEEFFDVLSGYESLSKAKTRYDQCVIQRLLSRIDHIRKKRISERSLRLLATKSTSGQQASWCLKLDKQERFALVPEQLRKINAYWRAANYLSVGQIYLYDNPLLENR